MNLNRTQKWFKKKRYLQDSVIPQINGSVAAVEHQKNAIYITQLKETEPPRHITGTNTKVNECWAYRSFDITWQEVQKAFEATLRMTGFWYILLKNLTKYFLKWYKNSKSVKGNFSKYRIVAWEIRPTQWQSLPMMLHYRWLYFHPMLFEAFPSSSS